MSDRYYIRLGKERGAGLYVRSYAGGDVTTTFNRWAALHWSDRDLVLRLVRVIRKVDGRHARRTVLRAKTIVVPMNSPEADAMFDAMLKRPMVKRSTP